jgi:hypothetical protein
VSYNRRIDLRGRREMERSEVSDSGNAWDVCQVFLLGRSWAAMRPPLEIVRSRSKMELPINDEWV